MPHVIATKRKQRWDPAQKKGEEDRCFFQVVRRMGYIASAIITVAPHLAAAAPPTLKYATSFVRQSLSVVGVFTTVAGAAALLFFFWGLAQFIAKSDDEQARSEGRWRMVWGIAALFVLVSVWAIIMMVGYIAGVGSTKEFRAPVVEGL